jgi:hypothetical protein
MSGRLNGRVRRLENGRTGPCPECGFDGDWSKAKIEIDWRADKDEDNGPKETIYCETCGEPVHIVLTWGDAPD